MFESAHDITKSKVNDCYLAQHKNNGTYQIYQKRVSAYKQHKYSSSIIYKTTCGKRVCLSVIKTLSKTSFTTRVVNNQVFVFIQ